MENFYIYAHQGCWSIYPLLCSCIVLELGWSGFTEWDWKGSFPFSTVLIRFLGKCNQTLKRNNLKEKLFRLLVSEGSSVVAGKVWSGTVHISRISKCRKGEYKKGPGQTIHPCSLLPPEAPPFNDAIMSWWRHQWITLLSRSSFSGSSWLWKHLTDTPAHAFLVS